ncbi:hypothetical protein PGT21_013685 [Puccinia graminis f. sp. tritici]|uniref:Uncharacterized protein n=1 Tax=Puccinia graminis f. sp. tritici TaxID=56615 RepID=A0A5B0R0H7_PUCGR|nr:hypothetical protein PGT21_013685 [Puccinia graminis f. sp. tritici]
MTSKVLKSACREPFLRSGLINLTTLRCVTKDGPARDDPIKGRVYSGCPSGARWAGAVNLAYPEVQTNPTSSSACDPSAASASGRISTSQ